MNGLTRVRQGSIVAAMTALLVLASAGYGAPIPLTNGVPLTGLSGAAGSETVYALVVPAGQDELKIAITGGTGDCDLYVKRDAVPTTGVWDYRPFVNGNEESVDVNNPAGGTWYIMLRGFQAYAGLTLTATYSSAVHLMTLTNNVPVTGLAGAKDGQAFYKIDVPASQTKLEISISGGTGDCDLYIKRDSMPTPEVWDYRPFQNGNEEKVTITDPAAGSYYIMLRGFNTYSGVTLLAAYTGNVGTVLTNGVPVTGIGGTALSDKFYRIDVPAGQLAMEIQITGGTGDCDLYVKFGAPPTMASWDYRPFVSGNEETVDVNNPTAGTWYIMLHGYSLYADLTLKATYGAVVTLTDGVPVSGISGALNSERFYQLDVPDGSSNLTFSISGGTGDCDLYVRAGAMPTTSIFDYRGNLTGNNETVTISSPHSGMWYVLLKGRQAYSGVTLLGDYSNVRTLVNAVPVSGLSGAEGSEVLYQIVVPSGQTSFVVQISGGTGDCDLYVKKDAPPTVSNWDGRGFINGNNETVSFTNPGTGTWYIMLRGYAAYANVTLVATYAGGGGGGGDVTLTNGVPVTDLSGTAGSNSYFLINVPAGQGQLTIVMSAGPGSTGDADMFIRLGTKPTTTAFDYQTKVTGNNESIAISNPGAGTWYILLNGHLAYSGVSLKATYVAAPEPVTLLTNGVPVTGLSGGTDSLKYFKIVVPAGQDYLRFETSGGSGDCDMTVKRGSKASDTNFDYFSVQPGTAEVVDISHPAADTWYVTLKGYTPYYNVTLVATYGVTTPTGNIFNTDPNCVALWRLEPSALTVDSRGTNTLTNTGVVADTSSFKQGLGSADFNNASWLSINDANLSAGFPFKHDGAQNKISVACWVKVDGLPTDNGPLGYRTIFAKDSATYPDFVEGFSIQVARMYYSGGYHDTFAIMVSHWGSYKQYYLPADVVTGRWYHLTVTYNNATKAYHIRAWDAQAAALLGDTTGTTDYPAAINTLPVRLGAIASGRMTYDGRIDEVAVFNDLLTNTDIDKIRQGTYGH